MVNGKEILWAYPLGCKYCKSLKKLDNVILLERPSMQYKVGDLVKCEKKEGTVVAIDPRKTNEYVVHLQDYYDGPDIKELDEQPWFPSDYDDYMESLRICTEDELTRI